MWLYFNFCYPSPHFVLVNIYIVMKLEIHYQFPSAQVANRFLNELKHWPIAKVSARLFNHEASVKITYQAKTEGFDSTCAELDKLAAFYNGEEC